MNKGTLILDIYNDSISSTLSCGGMIQSTLIINDFISSFDAKKGDKMTVSFQYRTGYPVTADVTVTGKMTCLRVDYNSPYAAGYSGYQATWEIDF